MTGVLIRRGNVDTEIDTGWVTQRHKEKTAVPGEGEKLQKK